MTEFYVDASRVKIDTLKYVKVFLKSKNENQILFYSNLTLTKRLHFYFFLFI